MMSLNYTVGLTMVTLRSSISSSPKHSRLLKPKTQKWNGGYSLDNKYVDIKQV